MGDNAREFVKLEFSDTVKEEILVEDDNNIVGIISQFEECRDVLEENLDDPGEMLDCKVKIEESKHQLNLPGILHQVDQKTRPAPTKKRKFVEEEIDIKTAFTDQEDMALHALDLISPYDINFASSHMARRSEKDIERRLDDNTFRKKYFLFQKIPSFLFGITFTSIKLLKFRALMLVSEKHISNLICVNKTCVHGPDILELTLEYDGKSKFGIDISILVEFINENCPERFKNNLKMTCESLESLLVDSKISFHRYATSIGHVYTKVKKKKEALSIKRMEAPMSFQNGRLILIEEHKQTLIKIVNAIGKTKWDFALKLMHDVFGKTTAPTYTSKIKLQNMLSKMYLEELDPDLKVGPWTEEEDKCLLFLHKLFYQVYSSFIYYSTRFTLPSYTILPGLLFLHNLFY
ncbi:uncharacterized protein LOC111709485 [Eurytemora carolleeae]|uniref:uncharacterized protein LOC111709485 n=1 Tax=Eurytemora carolleeae TaxID=1294199 RepID=UPI000C769CF4|nr:uncharacterized protein LOC111709485 [Eurytemora carolleeae]|eukprot:XP_023338922.1 uncharacterized protein LOC111709485 [Eurytemora affinis]